MESEDFCRICLSNDSQLLFINETIERMLLSLQPEVVLSTAENLNPLLCHICTICHERLMQSVEFQQMIAKADETLQSKLLVLPPKDAWEPEEEESQEEDHLVEVDHSITEIEPATGTGARSWKCNVCDRTFSRKHNCERHLIVHGPAIESAATTGFTTWKCQECDRIFARKQNCERHIMLVHGPPDSAERRKFVCEICAKGFSTKTKLHEHGTVHTGEKDFHCDQCGKAFGRKNLLAQHMLRHSEIKPYACVYCPFRFVAKRDLENHSLTHTGEKPWACDLCGKRFSTKGSIKNHARLHSVELRFSCDICEKKFNAKSHMLVRFFVV